VLTVSRTDELRHLKRFRDCVVWFVIARLQRVIAGVHRMTGWLKTGSHFELYFHRSYTSHDCMPAWLCSSWGPCQPQGLCQTTEAMSDHGGHFTPLPRRNVSRCGPCQPGPPGGL